MNLCPTHFKNYIVYCVNCEILLCPECLDTHGTLGHVIQSPEGAVKTFRQRLTEFHRKLKEKQKNISQRIQEITDTESHLENISEDFEEFSTSILAVFERIEEIVRDLKTSIITKYASEFEQGSSENRIPRLSRESARVAEESRQLERALKSETEWTEKFAAVRAAANRQREREVRSGCDGDGECRGSRARPTAATVAIEVLRSILRSATAEKCLPAALRDRLAPTDEHELHSAGSLL